MDWFTQISFFLPNWAWIVIALIVLAFIIFVIAFCVRHSGAKEEGSDSGEEWVESSAPADGDEVADDEEYSADAAEEPVDEAYSRTDGEPSAETEPDDGDKAAGKKALNKVYHISKRKADNMWQVKMAKGAKAIKLFRTQAEAIEFAKKLAENQEARIVIHKEDGSFRNLTYRKK